MSAPMPDSKRPLPRLGLGAALAMALLSGVFVVAMYPPYDLWPLAFVSLAPLLVALHGRSPREALWIGWMQGFGQQVVGSLWLPGVIRTFGELPWVVCTLIALGLCAYLGGRSAMFGWMAARAERNGWPRGAVVVLVFAATETLYPLLFPYYAAGGVTGAPVLLQLAELGGPILVGVPLAMASVAAAEPFLARLEGRPVDRRRVAIALSGPVVMLAFGAWRVAVIRARAAEAPAVRVGIVQGNTPHEGLELRKAMMVYRSATEDLVAKKKPDLVVWPETALTGVVAEGRVESVLREATDDPNGVRITVPIVAGTFIERGGKVSNSAVLFAGRRVAGTYDKMEPLAFGEYIPLGDRFPELYDWIKNAGHLTRGTSDAPLVLGEHRISALICYEDILPQTANHAIADADPDLLVNMTNDSWFGNSPVPAYHLGLAKLRTVEHRRYLVHATNSGISAFIDPTGKATGLTPVLQPAAEVETLHWMRAHTLYERIGDAPWWAVSLLVGGMLLFRRPRRGRGSSSAEG